MPLNIHAEQHPCELRNVSNLGFFSTSFLSARLIRPLPVPTGGSFTFSGRLGDSTRCGRGRLFPVLCSDSSEVGAGRLGDNSTPPPVLNNCYRTSRKKTRKTRNMPQSSFPYNISKRLPHAHCRNTSNWEDSVNKVAAMQSCMIKWHHKQTRWTAPSIPPGRDDSLRTSIRFKGGAFLIRNGLILFSLMHSRLFNGNLHIKIGFRDNRFPLHLC